jgi:hypothetical protein
MSTRTEELDNQACCPCKEMALGKMRWVYRHWLTSLQHDLTLEASVVGPAEHDLELATDRMIGGYSCQSSMFQWRSYVLLDTFTLPERKQLTTIDGVSAQPFRRPYLLPSIFQTQQHNLVLEQEDCYAPRSMSDWLVWR